MILIDNNHINHIFLCELYMHDYILGIDHTFNPMLFVRDLIKVFYIFCNQFSKMEEVPWYIWGKSTKYSIDG